MNAAGNREIGEQTSVKNRYPTQRQPQLVRSTEHQTRGYFKFLEIEIRLIEAIEKDETPRAFVDQAICHMGNRRKERTELHGERDRDRLFHLTEHVEINVFDFSPRQIHTRRHVIDI